MSILAPKVRIESLNAGAPGVAGDGSAFAPFHLTLPAVIRACRADDLPTLEWFGVFSPHRELFRATFEAQERGDALILIVEVNGVPSGQIFIDFARKDDDATGLLWAARVFPALQKLGLGTRLLAAAEQVLRSRGFRYAELTVEKDNESAKRLYHRLGYRRAGNAAGEQRYTTPEGVHVNVPIDQWVMRKRLGRRVSEPQGEGGGFAAEERAELEMVP
jgi:ribosomal protein S18 acetylase RimI-like enzyme